MADADGGKGRGTKRPHFPALSARQMRGGQDDFRRVRCPPHRLTPLKNSWENIVTPTVEHMKVQIRQVCDSLRTVRELTHSFRRREVNGS